MMVGDHYTESILIAHLDRTGDSAHSDRVERHLAVCDECANRFDRIRVRSDRLAEVFLRDDEGHDEHREDPAAPLRDRPRSRRTAFVAAAAVLLLAVSIPAGAAVWAWMSADRDASDVTEPTLSAGNSAGTTYSFELSDPRLVVSLTAADVAQRLVLRRGNQTGGSVTIRSGTGAEEVTLRPGRVELSAPSPTHAIVELSVPAEVVIRVEIAGVEQEPSWIPQAEGDVWTLAMPMDSLGPAR